MLYFGQIALTNDSAAVLLEVVPALLIPLNASDCMCDSLAVLAETADHHVFSPECATNEACDGIRCSLLVLGTTYYIEVIVLPCNNSAQVVVEDANLNHLESAVFAGNETRRLTVQGYPIDVTTVIIPREYSMEVQVCRVLSAVFVKCTLQN